MEIIEIIAGQDFLFKPPEIHLSPALFLPHQHQAIRTTHYNQTKPLNYFTLSYQPNQSTCLTSAARISPPRLTRTSPPTPPNRPLTRPRRPSLTLPTVSKISKQQLQFWESPRLTSNYTGIAGGTQSDSSKSTTQEAFDKTRREKDHQVHGGTSESVADKVKNAVGLGDK